MVAVGSCWKLLLCLMEPMPAGSRTHLLLAKAEPTGCGGSTPAMTCFRRGIKPAQMETGVRMWRETALRTLGSKKEGQEVLQAVKLRFP